MLTARAFAAFVAAGAYLFGASAHAAPGDDPLQSIMWTEMKAQFFGDAPVVFDDRVKVAVPSVVENQAQVPVVADARALGAVRKLVVFADLNPIQHVLTLTLSQAQPYVGFRMKVEQGTPVRAAAQTADGVWHVGGVFLDAAGGGCSAPAMARKEEDWSRTVGHARGRLWREVDGGARVRFTVRHPMDTGLARDNTPAYFIERLDMRAQDGSTLATLELREPMSEDPTLTMIVRLPQQDGALIVDGRDNNGETYRSSIPASWRQSGLDATAGGR